MSLLHSIYEKVRPRRVVPPMPAQHFAKVEHPEEEAFEPRPGRESGYAMMIDYVDSRGAQSFRRISCRRVDMGTGTIRAYCLERSGWRSFKLDGIREAFAADTGEAIDLGALVYDFRRRGLPIDDDRLARTMVALTFLMRCDGEAHPLEHSAIEEAVSSFVIRFEGHDAMYNEGIKLAGQLAPDGQDFVRTLKWVAKHPERKLLSRYLLQQACNVVDADGHIALEEVTFGGELSEYLKAIAASSSELR